MYRRLFLYICAFIFANFSTQQTLAVSNHFSEKPTASRSEQLLHKTPFTETRLTGPESFTATISSQATHYADELGNWHLIDPKFRAIEDGYVVEKNNIQTHVHRDNAQISAIANNTVINWQATAIGFETANAQFVPISTRKVAHELPQRSEQNQQLLFGDHWRNPIVSELIVSEAGSIEQSLRLEKRPFVINDPYYLVMQGELQLLPGSTLWSNGQPQQEAFHTNEALTIYSPENEPTFIFDPIIAYEEQNKERQINGSYHLTPTEDPHRWLVAVKTPWSWWENAQRDYPVILDPRIRVLTGGTSEQSLSTYSNAIGWTNDTMRLGPFFHHTEATSGFVQFNVLPAIPTNNAPLHITKASLRITPTGYWAPRHYLGVYSLGKWLQFPDTQGFLFFDGYQINTDVAYMGTCAPAQCPNNPATPSTTVPLKIAKGQQEANPAPDVSHHELYRRIDPVVTEIDVTQQLQGWYDNLISQNSTDGPTFRLQQTEICDSTPPYWGQQEKEAYHCTAVDIQPGGVELVIDFAPITLNNGQTIYNQQGVPSYAPGAFDPETKVVCTAWDASGETCYNYDYETTAHHYPVSHNIAEWQVVAARGNHDQFPAVDPSNVGLQLWPSPPEEEQLNPKPLAESSAEEGEAAFILIDGNNADSPAGVLRAAVSAIQPKHSAQNIDSNYAIQNLRATQWNNISIGTPFNTYAELHSNTLATLAEFDANNDENLMLSVQIPPDSPLKVYLFEPTSAFAVANRQNGIRLKGDNGKLYRNEPVNISGRHALLIVNDGPPVWNPEPDPEWRYYDIQIEILRCPQNTIPQQKHTPDCQPIKLPDSNTNVTNQVRYVRYATSPDRYLAVSSEGGYTSIFRTGGYEWCSTLEASGAPVVAPISPYGENPFADLVNPNQRWAVVGQGSICLLEGGVALDEANGIWAGDLVTTADSGLALTVNDPNSSASNRNGILRNRLFGQFVYPAIFTADGETTLNTSGHFIAKDSNTLINITPYQDWEAEYVSEPILDTGSMQLKATELINALVLGDFNQSLMATVWTSPWTITPLDAPTPNNGDKYEFDPNVDQNPPLPGQIPFSGWDLHIAPEQGHLIQEALWHRSGPVVHYFSAQDGRVGADSDLGSAMAINRVVIAPPGQNRADSFCQKNNIDVSCLDLRPTDANIWSWSTKNGAPPTLPDWKLPDLHITGQTGALLVSTPGQFNAFSTDHPLANNNINLPFSFDTWGGEVSISEGPCGTGGPIKTLVQGEAIIALPMIGVNDPQPGTKGVEAQFLLCETALHEMMLTFTPLQPIPIGNSGLGVTLLGGTVLLGPDSTRIILDINFESYPNKSLLSDGKGTVTLDTAGLLKLDASGELVGNFDATFSLAVAWDPLDILLQGDVKYKSSGLLTGYLYLHAWRGSGWQNKYPWITDDEIHFTGTIGGKLRIPKGELIDGPGPLDIPPTTLSLGADISFGEFCRSKNPCEAPYPWGVAATVSVLGYKAGVYIDKYGPEIILGTQGKVLIDQAGGANRWSRIATNMTPQGAVNYAQQLPGTVQDNLVPNWGNSFDGVAAQSGNFTDATNGVTCQYSNEQTTYLCDFTLGASGRGLWTVAWTTGTPTLSLKNPSGQISTLNNQAPGVSVAEINENGVRYVVFTAVSTPPSNLNGKWQLKLDNLLTGNDSNNFSIAFAADPPVPELNVLTPAGSPTVAGDTFLIEWDTDFGGTAIPSGDILELIYAPVFAPEPLPLDPITVAFPSEYLEEAGVDGTAVSDTNGDAVWVYTPEDTVAGEFTYMALINGTQEEQYGQNGVRNGEPIPITIQSNGQPARFYYDRRDNYVTSSLEDDIVVLVGDMMSEVGGADWTADNLTGWMKPTETGYEIILNLPAGNWQYKVALNESMAENYGQGGVLNGANIQLNVPVDGTAIRFHYDPSTHIISHETAAQVPGITISYTQAINNNYLWHTAGLATGEYIVGARLNDIQRGNSIITAWAPGTVWIEDLTPPPNPVPKTMIHMNGMIKVRWQPDTETPDLAGYQIEYKIPDVTLNPANAIQRIRRVLPGDRHGLYEESLLISDNSYPHSVCIRAFDASGNLSNCVSFPYVGTSVKPLPAAELFEAFSDGSEMMLSWYYPFETNGYNIRYGLAGCHVEDAVTIADEGASPLFVNIGITELLVTGLTPNQLYWFEVRAIDQWGIEGLPLRTTAMLIDSGDGNGDNVADEWAAFYDLPSFVSVAADSDLDGLTDREEYMHFANPHHADSDGDGYYDGNEAVAGTGVCNFNSHPSAFTQPKLTLLGNEVTKLIANKEQAGPVGSFDVLNFGSDEMVWTVESSANWLSITSWTGTQIDDVTGAGDATLFYEVDTTNLSPGFYTAEITVTSVDGPNSVGFVSETAVLHFELTILPAPLDGFNHHTFLPFIQK